jgi:GNAT superfamily N-acetyltransferase
LFINSIQIGEQFQRKGIGTEVISWLIKEARNRNLEFVSQGRGSEEQRSRVEIFCKEQI